MTKPETPFAVRRALEILHQEGCSFGGVPTASMIIDVIHKAGGKIVEESAHGQGTKSEAK